MDEDTIFTPLSGGEQILGKYVHSECRTTVQTIVILTNYRLLIRRKYTLCGWSNRSSYKSINLDSIDRVDEEPASSSIAFVATMLAILFISLIQLAFGIQLRITILNILAPFGIVLPIIGLILRCVLDKNNLILLYGTFGREAFKLDQTLSRDLEGKLIEMSFQTRLYFSNSAPANSSQRSQSTTPSAPAAPSNASAVYPGLSEKSYIIYGEKTPGMDDDDDDF